MKRTISFLSQLIDTLAPRACAVCGSRLAVSEEAVCAGCNLRLPRTGYAHSAYDNELARLFWGRVPVERCAAFFFYKPHTDTSQLIYRLKYGGHPELGEQLGRLVAEEFTADSFFDGITALLPVPLARERQRQRGYNQSQEIARGVQAVTGLPIVSKAVERTTFQGSQTTKDRWRRNENVEHAFRLVDTAAVSHQHLLLIDDIITTGATLTAAARELLKAEDVRLSILSLGFARNG
ncbi:MAG: ComF family protein [Prevotella sp.]|nr:ComF family protein [Prevotella sp.]